MLFDGVREWWARRKGAKRLCRGLEAAVAAMAECGYEEDLREDGASGRADSSVCLGSVVGDCGTADGCSTSGGPVASLAVLQPHGGTVGAAAAAAPHPPQHAGTAETDSDSQAAAAAFEASARRSIHAHNILVAFPLDDHDLASQPSTALQSQASTISVYPPGAGASSYLGGGPASTRSSRTTRNSSAAAVRKSVSVRASLTQRLVAHVLRNSNEFDSSSPTEADDDANADGVCGTWCEEDERRYSIGGLELVAGYAAGRYSHSFLEPAPAVPNQPPPLVKAASARERLVTGVSPIKHAGSAGSSAGGTSEASSATLLHADSGAAASPCPSSAMSPRGRQAAEIATHESVLATSGSVRRHVKLLEEGRGQAALARSGSGAGSGLIYVSAAASVVVAAAGTTVTSQHPGVLSRGSSSAAAQLAAVSSSGGGGDAGRQQQHPAAVPAAAAPGTCKGMAMSRVSTSGSLTALAGSRRGTLELDCEMELYLQQRQLGLGLGRHLPAAMLAPELQPRPEAAAVADGAAAGGEGARPAAAVGLVVVPVSPQTDMEMDMLSMEVWQAAATAQLRGDAVACLRIHPHQPAGDGAAAGGGGAASKAKALEAAAGVIMAGSVDAAMGQAGDGQWQQQEEGCVPHQRSIGAAGSVASVIRASEGGGAAPVWSADSSLRAGGSGISLLTASAEEPCVDHPARCSGGASTANDSLSVTIFAERPAAAAHPAAAPQLTDGEVASMLPDPAWPKPAMLAAGAMWHDDEQQHASSVDAHGDDVAASPTVPVRPPLSAATSAEEEEEEDEEAGVPEWRQEACSGGGWRSSNETFHTLSCSDLDDEDEAVLPLPPAASMRSMGGAGPAASTTSAAAGLLPDDPNNDDEDDPFGPTGGAAVLPSPRTILDALITPRGVQGTLLWEASCGRRRPHAAGGRATQSAANTPRTPSASAGTVRFLVPPSAASRLQIPSHAISPGTDVDSPLLSPTPSRFSRIPTVMSPREQQACAAAAAHASPRGGVLARYTTFTTPRQAAADGPVSHACRWTQDSIDVGAAPQLHRSESPQRASASRCGAGAASASRQSVRSSSGSSRLWWLQSPTASSPNSTFGSAAGAMSVRGSAAFCSTTPRFAGPKGGGPCSASRTSLSCGLGSQGSPATSGQAGSASVPSYARPTQASRMRFSLTPATQQQPQQQQARGGSTVRDSVGLPTTAKSTLHG